MERTKDLPDKARASLFEGSDIPVRSVSLKISVTLGQSLCFLLRVRRQAFIHSHGVQCNSKALQPPQDIDNYEETTPAPTSQMHQRAVGLSIRWIDKTIHASVFLKMLPAAQRSKDPVPQDSATQGFGCQDLDNNELQGTVLQNG